MRGGTTNANIALSQNPQKPVNKLAKLSKIPLTKSNEIPKCGS